MKKKSQTKVFADGVALNIIEKVTNELPTIMFFIGLFLRLAVSCFLFLHSLDLFWFIKHEKLRWVFCVVCVFGLELFLICLSLVSAQLRFRAKKLKKTGQKQDAYDLIVWAWTFFAVTLIGTIVINGVILSLSYKNPIANSFFDVVVDLKKWEVFGFLQIMNIAALFALEGSAFLLNSNAEMKDVKEIKVETIFENVTDPELVKKVKDRFHFNQEAKN